MFSFPGVCWYVLHDEECGNTSLFRAVRYDGEESVQALFKIHEGFAATEAYIVAVDEQTYRIYLHVQECTWQASLEKSDRLLTGPPGTRC